MATKKERIEEKLNELDEKLEDVLEEEVKPVVDKATGWFSKNGKKVAIIAVIGLVLIGVGVFISHCQV
ncbi:MAG: hypothetical protein GWN00_21600 [Aliifodinibius sp.]|nr:hypothetical protein [Fodinibius sp.]NIV13545.1 hypothetical protein [Fodinibius sp.]NIY27302.1 hypothetical protein [Fodinibius sp.]